MNKLSKEMAEAGITSLDQDQRYQSAGELGRAIATSGDYPTDTEAMSEALQVAEFLLDCAADGLCEQFGALRDSPAVLRLKLAAAACAAFHDRPLIFHGVNCECCERERSDVSAA